jgi:hypothetical protein
MNWRAIKEAADLARSVDNNDLANALEQTIRDAVISAMKADKNCLSIQFEEWSVYYISQTNYCQWFISSQHQTVAGRAMSLDGAKTMVAGAMLELLK